MFKLMNQLKTKIGLKIA